MISHALKFRSMNNPNHSGKIKKKSVEVKNSEKEVLRMSIGRKNREFSNELKGRGYPKNI